MARDITGMPSASNEEFAHLVARHQGAVCAVAYAVLRDRALSEEVAQEAFLLAWQKLPGMDPAPKLPGWICGIARNLARNVARRRRSQEMNTELVQDATPLDALLEREASQLARRALAELSEREREAVVLYYRGEQSMREVADALGISEEAAKKRVLRGRERMRQALAAVESTLRATRPGPAFTAGCVAALLAGGAARATATTTAATSASGGAIGWMRGAVWGTIGACALATALVVSGALRASSSSPGDGEQARVPLRTSDGLAASSSALPASSPVAADRSSRIARIAPALASPPLPSPVGTGTGGAPAEVRVYDLAAVSLLDPVPPSLATTRAPRPLTKHELRAALQSVQPLLIECYANVGPALAARQGTITAIVRLEGEPGSDPLVTSVRLEGDAHLVENEELSACFRETLLAIELTGIEVTGNVDVHYPLAIHGAATAP